MPQYLVGTIGPMGGFTIIFVSADKDTAMKFSGKEPRETWVYECIAMPL